MKRIVSIILAFAALLLTAAPVYAALPPVIEPQYVDATSAMVTLTIDDSGKATLFFRVSGKTSLTRTTVVSYLEKKVGTSWERVDIGPVDDDWAYTTSNLNFSKTYEHQLSSTGEYRAVCKFTFTGSTTEIVTKTDNATY